MKLAFTSLHIPEESAYNREHVRNLLSIFQCEGFEVFADVSKNTPSFLGLDSFEELKELGVTALRLDDGFTAEEMVALSHHFQVAINASTAQERELKDWMDSGLETGNMIAWHNFYPKPETGLDQDYFMKQQKLFEALDIPVYAFIPGDDEKRGPLYKGLPTLEDHRDQNPYKSAIQLRHFGVQGVFIGDPGCSQELLCKLIDYDKENVMEVAYEGGGEMEGEYQLRPDLGRDVYRLLDTRKSHDVPPSNTVKRPRGTITQDNDLYGRYKGEIQIVRNDLEKNPAVNVVGRIREEDLDLLELLDPGQKIRLIRGTDLS
jgi:uncharacterized protein